MCTCVVNAEFIRLDFKDPLHILIKMLGGILNLQLLVQYPKKIKSINDYLKVTWINKIDDSFNTAKNGQHLSSTAYAKIISNPSPSIKDIYPTFNLVLGTANGQKPSHGYIESKELRAPLCLRLFIFYMV
uniref:Uncharacterized protein n=1 Tax=Glossina austeni TaxID=7395 RepID=A0A1A9VY23_GLOAU